MCHEKEAIWKDQLCPSSVCFIDLASLFHSHLLFSHHHIHRIVSHKKYCLNVPVCLYLTVSYTIIYPYICAVIFPSIHLLIFSQVDELSVGTSGAIARPTSLTTPRWGSGYIYQQVAHALSGGWDDTPPPDHLDKPPSLVRVPIVLIYQSSFEMYHNSIRSNKS